MPYSSDETVRIKTVTANYSVVKTDDLILCDTSGGGLSITLLSTGGNHTVTVKKTSSDSNTVTVVGTIDGAANTEFTIPKMSLNFTWDGTDYHIT